MNLYLRYFNAETLVHTSDEAIAFLRSIPEVSVTPTLEQQLRDYAASNVNFPKRFKVRPRVYFIVIKTLAETMDDFKAKRALAPQTNDASAEEEAPKAGWYEVSLEFKRVVAQPQSAPGHSAKFAYQDEKVVYQLKAQSPADAYNRACSHLRQRVDYRSQLPSIKGKKFQWHFLGTAK